MGGRYTELMDFKLASKTLVLAVAISTLTLSAHAQWQWVDNAGQKVFSDRAPPVEIKDTDIFKRPAVKLNSANQPLIETLASGTSTALSSTNAPRLSGKDAELESRKKKVENEEVLKKKLEEENVSRNKSDTCDRARINLATLKSGIRITSANANGERVYFDEARLAAETIRTQNVIAENCR